MWRVRHPFNIMRVLQLGGAEGSFNKAPLIGEIFDDTSETPCAFCIQKSKTDAL